MAKKELKLPKMGESVAEATITSWLKDVGDAIEADEAVLEIATDKVDSEVPSEYDGVLIEKFFEVDDIVKVGEVIALIEVNGEENESEEDTEATTEAQSDEVAEAANEVEESISQAKSTTETTSNYSDSDRFYSPLVKTIAEKENISLQELDAIEGSGMEGRVTKDDILTYVKDKKEGKLTAKQPAKNTSSQLEKTTPNQKQPLPDLNTPVNVNADDEVIEMSRMGKMISNHMIASTQTSAHVQSFIEVDVTDIWNWRNNYKDDFLKREGEKLTITPIFMEIVAKTIKDFPKINISVDGDKIIMKKHINIGMAAALPDGNLIVPVIRDADQLNLFGMAKKVNDLAYRARNGKLKPDETQGGTYTVTNVGTFGSVMGTPIINQPQVGILALGAIRKVPAVIETAQGDFIGIRYKMFLSHSYDHRVVNGALGGQFIQRMKAYIEGFDTERTI